MPALVRSSIVGCLFTAAVATSQTAPASASLEVRWTDGFWRQRIETVRTATLPRLLAGFQDGTVPHLRNFRLAAGTETGTWSGAFSTDGEVYQWVAAASDLYAASRDPALERALDDVIATVARAQQSDGYLNTAVQVGAGRAVASCDSATVGEFRGAKRFTAPEYAELDNLGRLFSAAVAHHTATGKRTLLEVALKAANLVSAELSKPGATVAQLARVPSIIGGAIDLFRLTGEPRHLDLARTFLDRRGRITKADFGAMQRAYTADFVDVPVSLAGTDQFQERTPLADEREAVGNTVSAHQLYAGAAALQAATGDRLLAVALGRIWESAARAKMAVTGGTGAMIAAVSSPGYKAWGDPVWEAYGAEYELPTGRGFYGTGGNVGFAEWNWRMFEATGETRFLDTLERVTTNVGLSAMSLDGTAVARANPLRRDLPADHAPAHGSRRPVSTDTAGAVSTSRLLSRLASRAYAVSADGLRVNLYGANVLTTRLSDGTSLRATQRTDYPWDGQVTLTLDLPHSASFKIRLRVPGWCHAPATRVWINQQTVAGPAIVEGWLLISRTWEPGDTLRLDLPMPVELLAGHPKIEETRGHVAVQRGPLVYCMEGADLPAAARVNAVRLSRGTRFTHVLKPDLLGGVVVLEGRVTLEHPAPWRGELFRARPEPKRQAAPASLVPYFARDNRGAADFAVWFPLID